MTCDRFDHAASACRLPSCRGPPAVGKHTTASALSSDWGALEETHIYAVARLMLAPSTQVQSGVPFSANRSVLAASMIAHGVANPIAFDIVGQRELDNVDVDRVEKRPNFVQPLRRDAVVGDEPRPHAITVEPCRAGMDPVLHGLPPSWFAPDRRISISGRPPAIPRNPTLRFAFGVQLPAPATERAATGPMIRRAVVASPSARRRTGRCGPASRSFRSSTRFRTGFGQLSVIP